MLINEPDAALARMKKRYQPIVDSHRSTPPELADMSGKNSGTFNHAWSGGPLSILSQYFAGLTPVDPGWATYQVRPQPGPLSNIEATIDSTAGKISVEIRREQHLVRLKLVSPRGTTGFVSVPLAPGSRQSVLVNGKSVWANNQAVAGGMQGVSFKDVENGIPRFAVSPGTWTFTWTY